MSGAIPTTILEFLGRHIRSIAQLELLLALFIDPEKSWTAEAAAKELYIAASMTQRLLEELQASGLVKLCGEKPQSYQFDASSEPRAQLVAELAKLYHERRVSVINAIYSGPAARVQDFADAFRLRKREGE